MLEKIVVAVDCPGGDFRHVKEHPGQQLSHYYDAVPAVCQASIKHPDVDFVMVGDKEILKKLMDEHSHDNNIHIEHEPNEFPMGGKVMLYNGPSTIKKCAQMVAAGDASVYCSDGDSGAAAFYGWRFCKPVGKLPNGEYFHMSLVKGIPSGMESKYYVNDIGANKESTPEDLLVSALLTQVYAQVMHADDTVPSIGLLDTPASQAALKYFKQLSNFVGVVTPGSVYQGRPNVLITDGFTGNIYLKTLEAIAEAVIKHIKFSSSKERFKPYFAARPCCETGEVYRNLLGKEYTMVRGINELEIIKNTNRAVNCIKETRIIPKIGILSNGEEKDKGNGFAQRLKKAFEESPFCTIGFVEPKDLIQGIAHRNGDSYDLHIGATDEWTGKLYEETVQAVEQGFKKLVLSHYTLFNKFLKFLGCGPLQRLKEMISPDNHNGSAILGIRKPGVVGHGAARRKGINSMLDYSISYARSGYTDHVQNVVPEINSKIKA